MIEEAQTLIGEINNVELTGQLNKNIEYVEPTTQQKTITPTKQEQIVEPDEGVFALSKVIVTMPNEATFVYAGEKSGNWIKGTYGKKMGWASAKYLK